MYCVPPPTVPNEPDFTKTLFNRGFPDKNPDFQVYREYKNN